MEIIGNKLKFNIAYKKMLIHMNYCIRFYTLVFTRFHINFQIRKKNCGSYVLF